MSKVDYAGWTKNPASFLSFMKSNILYTGDIGKTTVYGMPDVLVMNLHDRYTGRAAGRLWGHNTIPVYTLVHAGSDGRGLKSYICDYVRSEMHYQVLDRSADFCFTITMNGCTFAIGSPTSDGSVLVSHTNQAGVGEGEGIPTGANMYEKQQKLADAFHGAGVTVMKPETYWTPNRYNATTFGVRTGTGWEFHYQSFKSVGPNLLEHFGVHPIKTNSFSL